MPEHYDYSHGPHTYPAEPEVDLRSARKSTDQGAPVEPDPAPVVEDTAYDPGLDEQAPPPPLVVYDEQLLPAPPGVETDPAQAGRRGRINRAIGLKLGPTPAEVAYRRAEAAVRQPLLGSQMVMVANAKGGQGKTVSALMLGHTFATLRRTTPPVVWDNAESEGTLGYRASGQIPAASVWDLIAQAERLTSVHGESSALSHLLRTQDTGAQILASDDSATNTGQIGAEHCRAIYSVLRRWRDLVIVDTSNNRRRSNWLWTAHNAQLLVIPIVVAADSVAVVLRMIEALREARLDDVIASAIVVLAPSPAGDDPQLRALIEQELRRAGINTFADVPFDPILAAGRRIDYDRLAEPTRKAWVHVAAMVATCLAAGAGAPTHWGNGEHDYYDPAPTPANRGEQAAEARIRELEEQLAHAQAERIHNDPGPTGQGHVHPITGLRRLG